MRKEMMSYGPKRIGKKEDYYHKSGTTYIEATLMSS
jgi:hypothetical protein